jgi:CHAT domain-containing protein
LADLADLYADIATLYGDQGYVSTANSLYQIRYILSRTIWGDDHPNNALSHYYLARFELSLGNFEYAKGNFKAAQDRLESAVGWLHPYVGWTALGLADVARLTGDMAEAERLYVRAQFIFENSERPNDPELSEVFQGLAKLRLSSNRTDEALDLAQRAYDLTQKTLGTSHPKSAVALVVLAEAQLRAGHTQEAIGDCSRAISILDDTLGEHNYSLVEPIRVLASAYWTSGRKSEAKALLPRLFEIEEERLRRGLSIGSEKEKDYLLRTEQDTNSLVLSMLSQDPQDREIADIALQIVLARKGRLVDLVAEGMGIIRAEENGGDLLNQLSALQAKTASTAYTPMTPETIQERKALELQIDIAESAINLEGLRIAGGSKSTVVLDPAHDIEAAVPHVDKASVQKKLPPDSALIEFIAYPDFNWNSATSSGRKSYAAFILFPSGQPISFSLGEASQIDSLASRVRRAWATPLSIDEDALARQLDGSLFSKIRASLPDSVKHLIISPDSDLQLISFGALKGEDDHRLVDVDRYQITYVTSGRDLPGQELRPRGGGVSLIVANPDMPRFDFAKVNGPTSNSIIDQLRSAGPLPESEMEANGVARILALPPTRVLKRAAATEEAVKGVKGPKILHLATHGFFFGTSETEQHDPLIRSVLLLAPSSSPGRPKQNGVLTAKEAASLNLEGTQLVVLSGCETGAGDPRAGDGVYGFRRALQIAGAQSLLVTLWKVDDRATTTFMEFFYDALVAGKGAGEALKQAQLALASKTEYSHPFYWAAFVTSGDYRALRN